jgi:hypothetical protein
VGWVWVLGAVEYSPPSYPLTSILSPTGRGGRSS